MNIAGAIEAEPLVHIYNDAGLFSVTAQFDQASRDFLVACGRFARTGSIEDVREMHLRDGDLISSFSLLAGAIFEDELDARSRVMQIGAIMTEEDADRVQYFNDITRSEHFIPFGRKQLVPFVDQNVVANATREDFVSGVKKVLTDYRQTDCVEFESLIFGAT